MKKAIGIIILSTTIFSFTQMKMDGYISLFENSSSAKYYKYGKSYYFESFDNNLFIKDQIFILDGHHRYQFIKNNSIDDLFEVVLVSMSDIKIESYNSELLIDDDIFVNKIMSEKSFSVEENSKYYISLNNKKYFSQKISDIKALYFYKKQLLKESVNSPIKNNEKTDKSLVKFTPLSQKNFSKNHIFPYKSTWITPRFDV